MSGTRPLVRLEDATAAAVGLWLGALALRASGAAAAWPFLLLGAAAGLGARRALPRLVPPPALLLLPLTLLPVPGWRTLLAIAAVFGVAVLAERLFPLEAAGVAARALGVACAAGLVVTTAAAVARILWLGDVRYGQDTAYAANILWNTLHGDFLRGALLQDLINSPPLRNDFGAHNSPLQLLLVPAYALGSSPFVLLVLRNLALWCAPLLLFRHLAREGDARWAACASLALAIQTAVLWQSVNAFYFIQMSLPLVILLLGAWERCALRASLGWLVLLLLVREDLSFLALGLALWALVERRPWRWAVTPAALGVAWWMASTALVLPAGGGGAGGAVMSTLAGLGATPGAIVHRALTEPGTVMAVLLHAENVEMLVGSAASVGWLGLLGPAALVAAPFAAINTLVDFSPAKEVYAHYFLLPVPFLLVGGMRLLRRAAWRWAPGDRRLPGTLALGLLCVVATGTLRLLPLEEAARTFHPAQGALRAAAVAAAGDAPSVAAPGAYLPSLANRPEIFMVSRMWEYPDARPQIVLYDTDIARANPLPRGRERYRGWLDELLATGEYERVGELPGGVVVLRRTAP